MKNSRVANSNDVFGQQQFTVLQISLSRADFFGLRTYIKASQANYYCNLGGFLIQWAGKPSDLFKVLPEEIYEKISIFLVGWGPAFMHGPADNPVQEPDGFCTHFGPDPPGPPFL